MTPKGDHQVTINLFIIYNYLCIKDKRIQHKHADKIKHNRTEKMIELNTHQVLIQNAKRKRQITQDINENLTTHHENMSV